MRIGTSEILRTALKISTLKISTLETVAVGNEPDGAEHVAGGSARYRRRHPATTHQIERIGTLARNSRNPRIRASNVLAYRVARLCGHISDANRTPHCYCEANVRAPMLTFESSDCERFKKPQTSAQTREGIPIVMSLVIRARNILVNPKLEWSVIAAEPESVKKFYTTYVGPLALIARIATFIGLSIIGFSVPFVGTYRIAPMSGLLQAAFAFAAALAGVFLLSLIINELAPTFHGSKDRVRALKVAGYAATPGFLAGVLLIFPVLGVLQLIAALYSLYLLYVGLPVLMKSPREATIGYTASVIGCAIVLGLIAGLGMSALHIGAADSHWTTLQR